MTTAPQHATQHVPQHAPQQPSLQMPTLQLPPLRRTPVSDDDDDAESSSCYDDGLDIEQERTKQAEAWARRAESEAWAAQAKTRKAEVMVQQLKLLLQFPADVQKLLLASTFWA